MKPTPEQIARVLADPVIQAYNPANDFVDVRWYSPSANKYACHGFRMGAALFFGKGTPHVKAPVAFNLLFEAFVTGELDGIEELFEATSGNTGHGLARLAHKFGIRKTTLIVPGDVSPQKRELLAALGATTLQHNDPRETTIEVAERMARAHPHGLHLNQYIRDSNWQVHLRHTGPQLRAAAGHIDVLSVPVGSGGQAKGLTLYYADGRPATRVLGLLCAPGKNNKTPGARSKKDVESTGSGWLNDIKYLRQVDRHDAFVTMRHIWEEFEPQVGPTSGMSKFGLEEEIDGLVRQHGTGWLDGKVGVHVCDDDGRMYAERETGEMEPDELFSMQVR